MDGSPPAPDGAPAFSAGVQDQTELERLLVDAFLENIPDSVYFKDRESRFIAVSKAKAERHGHHDPAALVGQTDADVYAPSHARKARQDEVRIMQDGLPIVGQVERLVLPTGEIRWSRTTKLPLRDADGGIVGTFGLSQDITAAHELEESLEKTKKGLIEASRLAGMAEVATGVLHNVGNVLNSLNVSAGVITGRLRQSRLDGLLKAAELLKAHADDLDAFLATDPKGRLIPEFVQSLACHLEEERTELAREVDSLQRDIDHIKDIVTMQQAYASMAGHVEMLAPADLVEDSLRMNAAALMRHDVAVVRDFQPVPKVRAERAKVLQILINLIRNAKYAIDERAGPERTLTLRIAPAAPDRVRIAVEDTGVGIAAEHLERLFTAGYTTRRDGHGFGLRSSLTAAQELGGSLTAESPGAGRGARFILELPAVAEGSA